MSTMTLMLSLSLRGFPPGSAVQDMNVVCLWSSIEAAHFLNSSGSGCEFAFKSRTKQANYRMNHDLQ